MKKLASEVEHPDPYDLTITTSRDGSHYQISFVRRYVESDESLRCPTSSAEDAGCPCPIRLEFLGYLIKRGYRKQYLPESKIRSQARQGALYAYPKAKSISRFMDQVRQRTPNATSDH